MAGYGGGAPVNPGPVRGPQGPTPTGPPRSQPRSSVVVRAHTRAAPASRPGRPSKPPSRPPNALLDPNQTLSGRALLNAARQLANTQTQGPLTELQRQIAANNAQTQGTVKLVGGYYNQLEPFVQKGAANSGVTASGLNSTLTGIGADTQSQLAGIGQSGLANISKYAPPGDGSTSNAASSDLAAQIARQQGLAAQQSGTYRDFGASQGANYQGAANANLGAYGVQGQEALRGIAQSGTVKNQPLVSKIADLQASKGALTATDLGKLRQQEVNNDITRAGLGLKQAGINATVRGQNITAAQDRARNTLTARGQDLTAANNRATQANRAASIAQSNLNNLRTTNTSAANNAANNSTRQLIAAMRNVNGKTGKSATGVQANAIFSHIDYVTGEIQNLVNHGLPPAQAYHIIQNGGRIQTGTSASGAATYRTYFPNRLGTSVLNAAFNARPGGSGLTAGDLGWFASLGIKNPTRYARAKAGGGTQHNAGPQVNSGAPSAGNLAGAGF